VEEDRSITPNDAPLARWVKKLAEEEMPVFAQTVGEINRILGKEEFSSLALAQVILQDPSMTAKILKLANSVFYNPGGTSISTISRAVVILGFNAVQVLCLSIAIIESLVRGPAKDRVMRELARAIHAATQSRNIALAQKDGSSEEVFIAALLLNLGQMAFWCFGGEDAAKLDRALQDDPRRDPTEVEKEVLGFKLRSLTGALAKEWKLTALVEEGLKGAASRDPRGKWIDLGHRVAREAENGWQTPAMRQIAGEVSRMTGRTVIEVGPLLEKCACDAVDTARAMGAGAAARLIPVSRKELDPESNWDVGGVSPWPNPDPLLQLKILRDITAMMTSKPDLNVVLEMVLEGIHRGVGMDRTVLALSAPRRDLVKAKHVLGLDRLLLMDKFWFELGRPDPSPLAAALEAAEATWFEDYGPDAVIREQVFEAIDHAPFFAAPVIYSGQPIGIFYADRHSSGRALDKEAFESFKLFASQANLGLDHVARVRLQTVK
jgi:HD-like signal output (HDOD) protein